MTVLSYGVTAMRKSGSNVGIDAIRHRHASSRISVRRRNRPSRRFDQCRCCSLLRS
jgi:hypothetical protein